MSCWCSDRYNDQERLREHRAYVILQVSPSLREVGAGNQPGTWSRNHRGMLLAGLVTVSHLDSLPFSSGYGRAIHPACAKGPISYRHLSTNSSLPVHILHTPIESSLDAYTKPIFPLRIETLLLVQFISVSGAISLPSWQACLVTASSPPTPFWTHWNWASSSITAQMDSFPLAGVLTWLDQWMLETVVLLPLLHFPPDSQVTRLCILPSLWPLLFSLLC